MNPLKYFEYFLIQIDIDKFEPMRLPNAIFNDRG